MKATVSVLARVKAEGYPQIPVELGRRGFRLPIEDRLGRVFEPDAVLGFYARYNRDGKRRVEPLGKDPVEAYAQYQRVEADFIRVKTGLLPVMPTNIPGHDIKETAKNFFEDIGSRGLKPRTIETYRCGIESFMQSCKKTTLEDVTERDLLSFIDWMKENLKTRAFGQPANTYRNRLRDVTVFFNYAGVKMPFPKRKWPKSTRKNADRYSMESINKMLAVATEDETDVISFFLYTGFRDEEAVFAKYSDIDFKKGTVNVHDKPEYEWSVKDHEQRSQDIILPRKFLKRMERRRVRYAAKMTDLIFPTKQGKPDHHLIYVSQRVGKRAGLEVRITQHKFRRTFGTMVAKQSGIEQARIWLGHSDIATTQRYLAADEMVTEQSKKAVNQMWDAVGD